MKAPIPSVGMYSVQLNPVLQEHYSCKTVGALWSALESPHWETVDGNGNSYVASTLMHTQTMRSGYPFLCGERPEGEFPRHCFLYVTKSSVKLFPLHRRDVGVLEIMLIGPFFGFYSCLSLLLFLFVPAINFYWALIPVLAFEMTKGWSWAVQAAFQSSLKRSSSHQEMQISGVKYGLVNHRLQGHVEGKRITLIVSCRRPTLAGALKLLASGNAMPSAVP